MGDLTMGTPPPCVSRVAFVHQETQRRTVLLEAVDDLGDRVEVADVPADLQKAQNARQNRFTIIVTALVNDHVRHPRAHLQRADATNIVHCPFFKHFKPCRRLYAVHNMRPIATDVARSVVVVCML